MKVGYVGYSPNLSHPGDRRRIGLLGSEIINTTEPLETDILVLSNAANFAKWISDARQPVILDLVDGYLGESPKFFLDFARNVIRTLNGKSQFRWILYTKHMEFAAKNADAIIVGSKEQSIHLLRFCPNVFVIADDHSELSNLNSQIPKSLKPETRQVMSLFWEGYGYTFKHFKHISKQLDELLIEKDLFLNLVTTPEFPRWGGYIGKVKIKKLIEKWFPLSHLRINVIPWSVDNVIEIASTSDLGIIPIDLNDKFASLKPENKLLSMWQLNLVTVFSETASYERVAREANVEMLGIKEGTWRSKIELLMAEQTNFADLKKKQSDYIKMNHTHDILKKKWIEVIETTISEYKEV